MNSLPFLRRLIRLIPIFSAAVFFVPGLSFSAQLPPGAVSGVAQIPSRRVVVPYISGVNDGLAYLVNTTSTRQDVYLAQLVAVTPSSLAQSAGLLQSYVSDSANKVTVNRMKATPANDRLMVQSTVQGPGFIDVDFDFFDMNTGAHQGFINEQAFATLNSSLHPSQRLAEIKAAWVTQGWMTAAQAAAFDYSLNPDNYGVFDVYAQWNSDGTATIFFETTVFLANAGAYTGQNIGTETFAINLGYSSVTNKMEIVDYGFVHAAATYPAIFNISIKSGATPDILFQGTPITFESYWKFYIFYSYETASQVEAEIPAIYVLQ